ncbi:MAG: mitochondrial carrier domain-containing protein [Linnemannia gamsii]|nr:MAG: mitochondrial carrier domain-containing protein [Linnemannia gamsii]
MPPVPETVDHSIIDFRRYYFYATIYNVPPIFLTYPFRTVRLLQQSKTSIPVSTSVFKVIKNVYRKNGFRALFAGSAIFTAGVTTTKILQFATYDYSAQKIKEQNYFGFPILKNSHVLSGILGTFSAVVTTFFIVPFDMVSQQITIAKAGTLPNASDLPLYVTGSNEPLERPSPMTISQSLRAQFRQEGLRFLFRGYYASLLSTGPFFAAYFPAYEISRVWVKDGIDYIREVGAARSPNPNPFPPASSHQFLISSIAGSIASLAGVFVSSPADMVKTRVQTEQRLQPTNGSGIKLPLPSLDWVDVFKDIVKKEGPMALFSGAKARAILAVPGGALTFIIFDLVRSKSLKEKQPTTMQAERQVMLETLFVLDKQFHDCTEEDQAPAQSVLLQTSGLISDQDLVETHMFNAPAIPAITPTTLSPSPLPPLAKEEPRSPSPSVPTSPAMPPSVPHPKLQSWTDRLAHVTLMHLDSY